LKLWIPLADRLKGHKLEHFPKEYFKGDPKNGKGSGIKNYQEFLQLHIITATEIIKYR
jgi:hypothetical protein